MSNYVRFLNKNHNNAISYRLGIRIVQVLIILVLISSQIGINLATVAAAGTTYYVNKTVTCSDSNPGTNPAAPFCTIGKGATEAMAGDTVLVLAGTYAETVNAVRSGTAGNPITFSATPGVIVTGNGTATGSAFRVVAQNYIVIDGFTINNTKENGMYLSGSNLTVSNNIVTNSAANGIYVVDSSSATISDNTISASGQNPALLGQGHGIYLKNTTTSTVDGNTTHHNWDGIRLSASSNNTVSENISYANVDGNKGNGIAMIAGSNYNTILKNITYANRDSGLQFETSTGNFALGNLSYHNGDHGMDVTDHALNHIIISNTIQGNHTAGINLEQSSTGSTVVNNIVADNGQAPIEGRRAYNIYVDNSSVSGTNIDYNLYWMTSPYTRQIDWNGVGYNSLAAFQAATIGQEDHGVQGNPLFIAPAAPVLDPYAITVVTGDYHINPGSPAIDSANSAAPNEPSTDMEGNPRSDDPSSPNTGAGTFAYYDRGAYEFQSGNSAPSLTTQAVSGVGQITATGNGTIVSLGSTNPTEHGFVWDTATNPTIALSTKTTDGPLNAPGTFTSSITGLTPGTLYHVRAYATNSVGTSYGNDVTFTSSSGTTVTITSNQTWTAPAGVTSVTVEAWGGGGGGANIASSSFGGGGGGGGAYAVKSNIAVVPGTGYAVVVGAGGTTGANGGDSSFNVSTVVAKGGNSASTNSTSGATGGLASASIGDTKYTGGGGANGSGTSYGGGGGASAGTGANGATATNASGATAPTGGGNGGDGKSSPSGNGTAGSFPGGGGGGSLRTSNGSATGGSGANGQVKITYVEVPLSTTTSVSCGTNTVVYGGNITCTATVTATSGTPAGTVSWVTSGAGSFTTSPCTLASGSCSVTYAPSTLGSGSHSITATYGGSASFLTSDGNQAVTVTPKALTMSGLSVPASKVYDGTTSAVVSGTGVLQASEAFGTGTTSDGKPYTGDGVNITGTPVGTYNSKDVPTATTVTFSGLTLGGTHANNYTLTMQSPGAGTITPKALTVTGLSAPASKMYDGTINAVVSGTPALLGPEAVGSGTTSDGKPYIGDAVNISGTAFGTYNSKHVNIATTVTFGGLSLINSQAGNYTLTSPTTPATITAKPITVTAVMNTKVYDGTTAAAAIPTNSGVIAGDTASFIETYNTEHFGLNNKTLTPSGIVTDGNGGDNYSYTFNNFTTGTISKAPIVVDAVTNTKVYDGTTTAAAIPTHSGVVAGDTANFIEAYSDKNIGTGNKTLIPSGTVSDGNGGLNYSYGFNNFTTGTITIKPIVVTAVTNTKVYDGTTTAAAIPTHSGIGSGDTANFIEAYLDPNVGSGNKTLVPTGTVTDGNSGLNYSYVFTTASTGTIIQATPTLSVTNSPAVFTGTPRTAIVTGSVAGVVSNVKYDGSSTAPTNIGTYAVTANFTSSDPNYKNLTDAPAGNFVISNDITPPTVSSSVRAGANDTGLASVDFTVTFSESVTGLDMTGPDFDDFALTSTGVTGAAVSGVSGSGATYTVTVNTGSGNGTIRLDIPVTATITDLAGNPLSGLPFITGETYTINKNVDAYIGGNLVGSYPLAPGQSTRKNYAGVDSGPVKVISRTGTPIISAIRSAWAVNGVTTSFSQLMGLPLEQLSDTYVFPGYNNVTLNDQLRIANVDTVPTTVTVTIGGTLRGTYPLAAGAAVRINYPGLDSGPVVVKGTSGVKIISSIREAWAVNGVTTSFVQLMGLPAGQLSNKYVFPAYNNVTLNEQLRIGNVDTVATSVTVTIGGTLRGTYPLGPGQAVRINYPGLDSGPVVVEGTAGVNIISSIRSAWAVNGVTTSFSQLMGMPAEQLADKYLFPGYNNVTLNDQLRIANVDTLPTTVTVTIGGNLKGTYPLAAGAAVRINYAGLDSGPVVVQGTSGVKIISSIREAWAVNGVTQSFVQLMGLPAGQLSTTYFFPGYNNITLDEQLRIGMP